MEASGQFVAPAALLPGKEVPVAIVRRLGGSENRSGRCGEEKYRLPLRRIEILSYIPFFLLFLLFIYSSASG
jgi:hypothetical protein